jgi:hypothetical protein
VQDYRAGMRTRVFGAIALIALAAALVLPSATASAKPVSKANLKALTNSINRAKHLTFAATYTAVNGGQTSTVTIAQKPPKSNFSSSGGEVINDGKHTYYCSSTGGGGTGSSGNSGSSSTSGSSGNSGNTGSGKSTCISVKGSNPLLGIEAAYSSTAALSAFAQARQGLVSRLLGIKVSSSSATFAGQPSTCITVTVRGRTAKYCVTKQGILAYSGTGSDYFKLTQYSSNPSASLFSLPAGATTQSVPSVP